MSSVWDGERGYKLMLVSILVFMPIALSLVIWVGVKEDRRWDAFKAQHACKVVRRIDGSVSTGVNLNPSASGPTVNPIIITDPGKTCWACDDGVEYCR